MNEIVNIRLDERLIHGQVATMWIGLTKATRVMVIDDDVVNDQLTKVLLKEALPKDIKLSILKIDTAIEKLNSGNYNGQRVFILVKTVKTLLELIEKGLNHKDFNLGNTSRKENQIQIAKSVYLDADDVKKLREYEDQGYNITVQMVPSESAVKFKDVVKEN